MKNKKLLSLLLCLVVLVSGMSNVFGEVKLTEAPNISTLNYILINGDTGEVLLSGKPDAKAYPASTTKVMTALLAIENLDLEGTSEASSTAVNTIPWDSSKIDLRVGEVFDNKLLITAMMVASGNDAANVLAEAVSGDLESFAKLMNERAKELGCTGTNFVNAHGYHDDNHYTTVSDMAKIAKKAMEYPVFREIVKTTYCEIPRTELYDGIRRFYTTNNLLTDIRTSAYKYEFATGIKTGYTSVAGNCLVSSAEKNGAKLIAVVFGSTTIDGVNMSCVDSKALFEWGFENYERNKIVKEGEMVVEAPIKSALGAKTVKLIAEEEVGITALKGDTGTCITKKINYHKKIKAPVSKGEGLGVVTVFRNGKVIGTVALVADKDYEAVPTPKVIVILRDFFRAIFR